MILPDPEIIQCKTITPMFSTGASKIPELRPAEFKANMMFWWRAFHPDLAVKKIVKDPKSTEPAILPFENLRIEETKLFGGQYKNNNKEVETMESKMSIVLSKINSASPQNTLLVHHKTMSQLALNTNLEFEVQLDYFNPSKSKKEVVKKQIYFKNLFKLSSILGGVGKRSRRGNGCFCVLENKTLPIYSISDILDLIKLINPYISNNYIINDLGNCIIYNSNSLPKYPCVKKIFFGKQLGSSESLRHSIDIKLGKFHKNAMKSIIDITRDKYEANIGYVDGTKRFASPLYFSIIPAENNQFRIIAILLNTVDFRTHSLVDQTIQEKVIHHIINE